MICCPLALQALLGLEDAQHPDHMHVGTMRAVAVQLQQAVRAGPYGQAALQPGSTQPPVVATMPV